MFTKILIANRGEIACRIIKTAQKMGIQTVAVYSDADRQAVHVRLADEAVCIGPAPSRESYLCADKIIAAAKQTGAQAVHPGYGFLSENADFAKQVEAQGLVFIGPKHHAIAAMGDKIASKKLAQEAQVNTIPGWNAAIESPERAVQIAKDIGYPVMIKASAGGGGKGLRVAFNDQEAFEGFASCRNEAASSFGDDRVFIEKFIQEPRHIEIQVLGDSHGQVIYLNERECSIQRRHQKVIEEAPSPFISDATRQAMGAQAVALAQAVNYQSAGTVEFVVGQDQSFYFLEMNTRLQVEHPVTECITGLDLVELMIRVAAGEALPLTQADVQRQGWAIECRINAEDPTRNFLPSTGRLVRFEPPAQTAATAQAAAPAKTKATKAKIQESPSKPDTFGGVRVDTGVEEGSVVSVFYDSMLAKLIVHGKDRLDAIAKMREALNGFVIRGVASSIPFQAALLAHPRFVAGDFNTGFIAENYAQGFNPHEVPHTDPHFLHALAAFVNHKLRLRAGTISGQMAGHEVRLNAQYVVVELNQAPHAHTLVPVTLGDFADKAGSADCANNATSSSTATSAAPSSSACCVHVKGRSYHIQSDYTLGQIRINGTCNGQAFTAQVERGASKNPLALRVIHHGRQMDALVLSPQAAQFFALMPRKAAPDMSRFILSPMPGLLAEILVQPGQKVQRGERVAVVEAMKMENILTATQTGTVLKVLAQKGQSLAVDQAIVEFE